MFIVGDEYDLWDRHPIWQQLKIALPMYHTDPFLVDTIASAVSDFGKFPIITFYLMVSTNSLLGGAKSVEHRINDLALINSIYNKMQ